jgi:uncharacterized protein (TIGR03437 family)
VTNPPPDGTAALTNPLSQTVTTPSVSIGGASATVLYSGLAPFAVGLYQVNAVVPSSAPSGDAVPVIVTVDTVASNPVTVAVDEN